MALMEVTLKGLVQDQLTVNRLNFVPAVTGTPVDLYSLYLFHAMRGGVGSGSVAPAADSLLKCWVDCLCVGQELTEIVIRDVYNENDLLTVPLTGTGWDGAQGTAGALQQTFVVSKIRSNRTQQGIKAGSLSVGSVPDSNVADDGTLSGAWTTLLNTLGAAFDIDNLTIVDGPSSIAFQSVIVQKERYTIEHLPPKPDTFAYKYYADPAVQATHIMYGVTWSAVTTARSLVSRKIGKGA